MITIISSLVYLLSWFVDFILNALSAIVGGGIFLACVIAALLPASVILCRVFGQFSIF
jgi:hypothetical protein